MKKKLIPLYTMLIAGAIAVIRTFLLQYTVQQKLLTVFVTLVVFYILGSVFSAVIEKFEFQNEEKIRLEEERIAEEERLAEEERMRKEVLAEAENIDTDDEEEFAQEESEESDEKYY